MDRNSFEALLNDYIASLLWCNAFEIARRRAALIRYVFPEPETDPDAEVQAGYAEDEERYAAQVEREV